MGQPRRGGAGAGVTIFMAIFYISEEMPEYVHRSEQHIRGFPLLTTSAKLSGFALPSPLIVSCNLSVFGNLVLSADLDVLDGSPLTSPPRTT